MKMRCTCCGQWKIEAVQYTLAARKHRGPLLVLTHGTVLMGEWHDVAGLEQGLRDANAPALERFEEC